MPGTVLPRTMDGPDDVAIARDPDNAHLLENGENSGQDHDAQVRNLHNMGMNGGPKTVEFAVGVRPREGCCGVPTVKSEWQLVLKYVRCYRVCVFHGCFLLTA